MQNVYPNVYLIGETRFFENNIKQFLEDIKADGWWTATNAEGELLIEFFGRLCYKSFLPGLNPNVTKVRKGNDIYIRNLLDSAHTSVLEHAVVNFVIHNVSKVFTEELCRHRVGVAISGESGRYVRTNDLHMWVPPILTEGHPIAAMFIKSMLRMFDIWIEKSAKWYGLDNPTGDFAQKKLLTSAIRRLLPQGKASTYGWSANFRTLRHCLNMRTSPHAEEEMIIVFNKIGEICLERYPNIFQDVNKVPIDGTPFFHYQFN